MAVVSVCVHAHTYIHTQVKCNKIFLMGKQVCRYSLCRIIMGSSHMGGTGGTVLAVVHPVRTGLKRKRTAQMQNRLKVSGGQQRLPHGHEACFSHHRRKQNCFLEDSVPRLQPYSRIPSTKTPVRPSVVVRIQNAPPKGLY